MSGIVTVLAQVQPQGFSWTSLISPVLTILFGGIVSAVVAQWIVRSRESQNALRATLVKLNSDTKLLAIEYIANVAHAQQHDTLNVMRMQFEERSKQPQGPGAVESQNRELVKKEDAHREQSVAVCLSSRIAIINVEGDLLSLRLLTGDVDTELEAAVVKLLFAISKFVPTSKGGRVPDRAEYVDFNVELATNEIGVATVNAWNRYQSQNRMRLRMVKKQVPGHF
jgi:hypothetical protein